MVLLPGGVQSRRASRRLGARVPDGDLEDPDRVSLRRRLLRDQGRAEAARGRRRHRPARARRPLRWAGHAPARKPQAPSARRADPDIPAHAAHGRRAFEPPVSAYEEQRSTTASDLVSGYLAALAIFIALIGLAWHPLRLIGPAIVIALVAAGMGGKRKRLAFAAMMIVTACFFLGMMIAV